MTREAIPPSMIDGIEPTAIIKLSFRNNDVLSDTDMQAITSFILGSVEGLEPDHLVITDNMNNIFKAADKSR